MTDASAALASVAGEGLDALRSKIGDVGKSCKGCHDNFRAKDF
jgi:cytochrome c556